MSYVNGFAALHNQWLASVFERSIPEETYSTCMSCPMCDPSSLRPAGRDRPFSVDTKCCTYWPVLPNYLIGSALADRTVEGEEGRRRITGKVATDDAVPRGMGASESYSLLYAHLALDRFGDLPELRCPYFEPGEGLCSIWRHRNGVCATWHCKPRRGALGEAFWESAKALLGIVERAVSLHCALELGVPLRVARELPRPAEPFKPVEGIRSRPVAPAAMWGPWDHRREEFYQACFDVARQLTWNDVVALDKVEIASQAKSLQSAFANATIPSVVKRAIPGPVTVIGRTETAVFVQSYRESDPQRIDAKLFHALRHCHGQATEELCETILREDNLEVDQRAIRRLADLRILIDIT